MLKQEHVKEARFIRDIRVFISSPGDMQKERELVVRICEEITRDLGGVYSFRIDAVRWETHCHSALGARSQEVITDQIGEYDIFLGLMGFYFGSNTGRYGSGTEEEFQDGMERNKKTGSPLIQFYFSDAQVSLSEIDLEQYKKVQHFKSQAVGEEGVFYREFVDLPQLELLVRSALNASVHQLLKENEATAGATQSRASLYSNHEPYKMLNNFEDLFASDQEVAVELLSQEAVREIMFFTKDLNAFSNLVLKFNSSMTDVLTEGVLVNDSGAIRKAASEKLVVVYQRMDELNNWMLHRISEMETIFTKSLSAVHRVAIIQRETSNLPTARNAVLPNDLAQFRSSLSAASESGRLFVRGLPEIDWLDYRWRTKRKIMIALIADFCDFLDRGVAIINSVETTIFD